MSYPSNQNNAHTYGWPPNPRFFFLPRSPLFCIRPYLSLSFWPVARSTSRCRQLTTRGLGCDHKTHKSVKEDLWNPSTRPREKIQNSDESRRGASMREQCRRVHPHLLFFFQQFRLVHKHDLPGKAFTFTETIVLQYRGVSKGRSIAHRQWMRFCHSSLPLSSGNIFFARLSNFMNRSEKCEEWEGK